MPFFVKIVNFSFWSKWVPMYSKGHIYTKGP